MNGNVYQISFDDVYKDLKQEQWNIVLENQNLIYKVLIDLHLIDKKNEYFDIALIAMFEAIDKYNPKKSSLSHYFYMIIFGAISNCLKAENIDVLTSKSVNIEFLNSMYDDSNYNIDLTKNKILKSDYDLQAHAESRIIIQDIVNFIKKNFTTKETEVFMKFYGINCDPEDSNILAQKYQISISGIHKIITKIKHYIKIYFKFIEF